MANITVTTEIDTLLKSTVTATGTTISNKSAVAALGAVVTGGALGTPAAGSVLTNATGLPIDAGTIGTLPVNRGGTGAATLAANNVLLGNGTTALQAVAPSTSGNVLTSNGSTWQSLPAATAGNLTSGPVTSSSSVSAIADSALSIAKTSGLQTALDAKQATLSSGVNIKTVNNNSLVGGGNVTITGSDAIDVTASPYNAVGDGRRADGVSMSSGSTLLTSTNSTFYNSGTYGTCVGKRIRVEEGTTVWVPQVETATAAGSITGSGTLNVVVTSALLTATAPIAATVLVAGTGYFISELSNTNFTLIGATSNTVGEYFVATGAGTGTGTARPPETIPVAVVSGDSNTVWAAKVRAELTANWNINQYFTIGGSAATVSLTSKIRGGNDATLNIAFTAGTCTNASLPIAASAGTTGVAPVDLITTIAGFTNSNSVTLASAAGAAVSNKSAFHGTDNTTAIQAALDAALSTTSHREVLIPKGAFLCNVRLPSNVKLRGIASSSLDVNIPPCAPTWDANSHPSILLPAISTSPVVLVGTIANASTTGFGSEMSNLSIIGSAAKVGDGFRAGEIWNEGGGVFNVGNNRLHQLWVGGFENGISFGRAVEPLITLCFVHQCINAFSFSSVDSADVTACYTSNTTKSFRFIGCKTFVLGTGSYDDTQKVMEIADSAVNIRSINTERVTVSAFDLFVIGGGCTLNIDQVMCLNHDGPFIRNHATEANRSLSNISVRNTFSAKDYVTINSRMPELLPAGMKIVRHADIGFATPILTRFSGDLYYSYRQSNAVQGNMTRPRMQTLEKFVKGWTEPYGELDWARSIITGGWATPVVDDGGGLRFTSSSAPSSMRFMFNKPWLYDPKDVLIGFRAGYIGTPATSTTRLGFYAKDTTPVAVPQYGYGLRVSLAAGDTVVSFESITNGIITSYPTTIPHANVTNAKFTLYIRVTDATVYLSLFNNNGALLGSEQSFARPASGSNLPYAPAFFLGDTTTNTQGILYEMWMEDSN